MKTTVKTLKLLALCLTLVWPLSIYSQTTAKKKPTLFVCPAISSIQKNTDNGTWNAGKNFKSFSQSLATKLTQFLGAQWHGATVGQIFCVYKTEPDGTFPVILALQAIAKEPSGHQWGKDLGAVRNCKSHRQKDCPFALLDHPHNKNIYQQLEQLKS